MFGNHENYRHVKDSGVIDHTLFSRLYGTAAEDVEIFTVDAAQGIKVTIPRPVPQGDIGDSDSYGCQLFGPLVNIEVPESGE